MLQLEEGEQSRKGVVEGDDGRRTDGVDESLSGAPILHVPEFKALKTDDSTARKEDPSS